MNLKGFLSLQVLLLIALNAFSQSWSKSYTSDYFDASDQYLGGSEVLQLIGHKGELFASLGYWQDENNIWYGGTNPSIGWGQIMKLNAPTAQWQEDLFLGASYLRPELLKQIIFTKDASGNVLSSPDTVLISGAYSSNFITSTVTVKSFVRNDANGTWGESQIIQGSFPAGENYSIRDIEVYIDPITGIERVYASVGTQGLYAGKYNASTPGKINWIPVSETGPLSIRPLGITTANSNLYFSSGNKLYKRNNGSAPSYSIIHDFSDLSNNINSAVGGIRGLSTIANPNGNDEALLLMWCPNGQSQGIIYRLEPDGADGFDRIYEAKLSLLVEEFLPGSSVSYLLGAYNDFYEYFDPITNQTVQLIGFEANITGGGHPTWNGYYSGALFAKRTADAQYTIEEINGAITPNDPALVATRCYVNSPFENENALYLGGFDPNGNTATNLAWIYKKSNPSTSTHEEATYVPRILVYPNPATNQLNIQIETSELLSYEVFSILGKKLLSGFVNSGKQSIDISALTSNVYFIKVDNQITRFMKID